MKFQTWDNLGQDLGQNYNITLTYNTIGLGQTSHKTWDKYLNLYYLSTTA